MHSRRLLLLAPSLLLSAPVALRTSMRLSFQGLGPLRIGMSEAQIRAALAHTLRSNEDDLPDGCHYLSIEIETASPLAGISCMIQKARLVRVDVDTPDWQTLSGARVRMPEDQLRRIYGRRLREERHPYDETGRYLILASQDPTYKGLSILFESDGERVTRMRAGLNSAVALVEGCA